MAASSSVSPRPQGNGLPLIGGIFALGGAALGIYTYLLPKAAWSNDDILFRATMSLVIAGVGLALMFLGRQDHRAERESRTLGALHPREPWLWREDWTQGYCRPESKSEAGKSAAMGLICMLMGAPIAFQLPRELHRGNYPALLGLVFPLVGMLLLGYSFTAWLRLRKFAGLRFTLQGVPAPLGGRLRGRVEGAFPQLDGAEVELTISCVRSYISDSNKRTRWQRVLWQDKTTVTALTTGLGCAIPLDFALPYDASPTDSRNPDDEILWRLTAVADIPGLDFRNSFQVPVFHTEAGNRELTIAALEARAQARQAGIRPGDAKVEVAPAPAGGARLYLPPARNKGAAAALTLFGLMFLGSGLFFGYGVGSALWWGFGLIILGIFGGIGLLLLMLSFGMWFGATTVEAANRELRVRTTYLVFSQSRVVRADEIAGFDLHAGMQRGDQVWYDLRVRLTNGRKLTAGSDMPKEEANWFLGEVKKGLGMQ